MARILFIAPADLGESVLATGALAHLARDGDALTVLCEPAARALYRSKPGVRAMVSPMRKNAFGAWAGLALVGLGRPFDVTLDLRGGPGGALIATHRRLRRRPSQVLRHFVEEVSELVGDSRSTPPMLWLDDKARQEANAAIGDGRAVLVLAPGGVSAGKRWPGERFAAVARRLTGGPLVDAKVIVLGAAARDRDICANIARSLDADGVSASDLGGGLDLLAAAALMERATLCIGNDNALTHVAAATGAPTLTLFGPTDERVRAPWGPRARALRAMDLREVAALGPAGGRAAMDAMGIDAVEAAALEALLAGGLG